MNNHHNSEIKNNNYKFSDFIPLIVIFFIILLLTSIRQFLYGWNSMFFKTDFMGFFFLIFGLFKIWNLKGFVEAYSMYDLLAKRSRIYAYIYPFIEVTLGLFYLLFPLSFGLAIIVEPVTFFTLILMLFSALGVANELLKEHKIVCACLGAVFKIPMTYVTLIEDLLMAAMALVMLFDIQI